MAKAVFFQHTKTGRRYRVVRIDRAANTVTLKGDLAEFQESYDKATFTRLGYELVTEDEAE